MWTADDVVAALRTRGELWESAPGAVGLSGAPLALYRQLEATLVGLAREEAREEWRVPSAVDFRTLVRADYFASFPQWLTVASHLDPDPARLERLAVAPDPESELSDVVGPCEAALPPAVCYHVYPRFADRLIPAATVLTVQGTCWRHEGERLRPLERGWAFTMREIVCLGTPENVETFRRRCVARVRRLLPSLGLTGEIVPATDPFFAPTARGRGLLQRLKGLKDELRLPIGRGEDLAVASFNDHERYFGQAFNIRLTDGTPAASGCVAFGLERWLLAFLVAHGPDPNGWPAVTERTPDTRIPFNAMEVDA